MDSEFTTRVHPVQTIFKHSLGRLGLLGRTPTLGPSRFWFLPDSAGTAYLVLPAGDILNDSSS
jgi:hypothetical protein